MTKLEEQIQKVHDDNSGDALGLRAREALAELVKRYIEKAYKDVIKSNFKGYPESLLKEEINQWLIKNGIVEPTPLPIATGPDLIFDGTISNGLTSTEE